MKMARDVLQRHGSRNKNEVIFVEIFMETLESSLNVDRANEFDLNDSVCHVYESYEEYHYISESQKKSLAQKVKMFIDRLIAQLAKFKEDLQNNIRKAVADKKVKKNLKKTRDELIRARDMGSRKVITIDVIRYKERYMECYKNLWKIAKRFDKVEYKSVHDIDADLKNFNAMYDKYTAELKEIGETKIERPINDVIQFCEYELDGRSAVFKTLNDTEKNLKDMKTSADALERKRNILGDEVIPKRVTVIQKVSAKMCSFVKNCITKFIMTVIIVLA